MQASTPAYAGFWRRSVATSIDVVLMLVCTMPLLILIYGIAYFDTDQTGFIAGPADLLISYVLPSAATIWFWVRYRATPGKLILSASVVDASTHQRMTTKQAVIRYLAYVVSLAPFGLGCLWIAFDDRKQGWHDKIAGTVVVFSDPEAPVSRGP
jgi:uncharacterized RDD family membrane protein YckC